MLFKSIDFIGASIVVGKKRQTQIDEFIKEDRRRFEVEMQRLQDEQIAWLNSKPKDHT
jgi:hypothetical protein